MGYSSLVSLYADKLYVWYPDIIMYSILDRILDGILDRILVYNNCSV